MVVASKIMDTHSALIKELRAIMADDSTGPVAKYTASKSTMLAHKVGYVVTIHPTKLLVHKANRNGLGVNAHNAHRNMLKVYKMGADISLLVQACATELPPCTDAKYAEFIDFNKRLVDSSQGMLAPVTHEEKYATLGTSHTSAFCKAALAFCKTKYKDFADGQGNLNPEAIKARNKDFRMMLEEGWDFFVAPWWIEDYVPTWPQMAQKALNIHHAVVAAPNEVEVACSLLDEFEALQSWKDAIDSIAASEPPCKDYLNAVAKITEIIGKEPMKCVGTFLKDFACSVHMGTDFTELLATMQFPKSLKANPFLRMAMMITQLTSPEHKVKDGIGRLLTVADLNGLKSDKKLKLVLSAESAIAQAWEDVKKAIKAGVSEDAAFLVFAKYCVKIGLHITAKEKWGIITTKFDSIVDITTSFKEDFDKLQASDQVPATSETNNSDKTEPSSSSKPSTFLEQETDLDRAKDKFNFKLGDYYHKKSAPEIPYKITQMTSSGIQFKLHDVFDVGSPTETVPIDFKALAVWAKHSGKVCKSAGKLESCLVKDEDDRVELESSKAKVWLALVQAKNDYDTSENYLVYLANPTGVASNDDWAKEELVLVPMTDNINKLTKFDAKDAACADVVAVTIGTIKLVISPSSGAKPAITKYVNGESKSVDAKVMVSPFWWVGSTKDPKKANMKAGEVTVNDIKIPTLVNSKPLKKNEVLYKLEIEKKDNKKARKS